MPDLPFNPVFLVGCPRSGTSVTKKVLRGHPGLASCGVEHHYILELADHFGVESFSFEQGLEVFSKSQFAFGFETPAEDSVARSDGAGALDVADFCQLIWRAATGADPSQPLLLQYAGVGLLRAEELLAIFPTARFIVITRDPRANIASQIASFGGGRTVTRSINLWKQSRSATRDLVAMRPQVIREIAYEDLVEHPAPSLRAIVEFIGLEWSDELLEFQVPMSVADSDGSVERRTFESFDPAMLTKWQTTLSESQMAMIEMRCRSEMRQLGYRAVASGLRARHLPEAVSDIVAWARHRKISQSS